MPVLQCERGSLQAMFTNRAPGIHLGYPGYQHQVPPSTTTGNHSASTAAQSIPHYSSSSSPTEMACSAAGVQFPPSDPGEVVTPTWYHHHHPNPGFYDPEWSTPISLTPSPHAHPHLQSPSPSHYAPYHHHHGAYSRIPPMMHHTPGLPSPDDYQPVQRAESVLEGSVTSSGGQPSPDSIPTAVTSAANAVESAMALACSAARPQPARSPYEWMKKPSYQTQPTPGKTRTKDKYRVVYSDHQRLELEKEFHYSRYITIRRKAELASLLGLTERQVKIWFQNRRAKERKQAKKREELMHKEKMEHGGGSSSQIGQGSQASAAGLSMGMPVQGHPSLGHPGLGIPMTPHHIPHPHHHQHQQQQQAMHLANGQGAPDIKPPLGVLMQDESAKTVI